MLEYELVHKNMLYRQGEHMDSLCSLGWFRQIILPTCKAFQNICFKGTISLPTLLFWNIWIASLIISFLVPDKWCNIQELYTCFQSRGFVSVFTMSCGRLLWYIRTEERWNPKNLLMEICENGRSSFLLMKRLSKKRHQVMAHSCGSKVTWEIWGAHEWMEQKCVCNKTFLP